MYVGNSSKNVNFLVQPIYRIGSNITLPSFLLLRLASISVGLAMNFPKNTKIRCGNEFAMNLFFIHIFQETLKGEVKLWNIVHKALFKKSFLQAKDVLRWIFHGNYVGPYVHCLVRDSPWC